MFHSVRCMSLETWQGWMLFFFCPLLKTWSKDRLGLEAVKESGGWCLSECAHSRSCSKSYVAEHQTAEQSKARNVNDDHVQAKVEACGVADWWQNSGYGRCKWTKSSPDRL